MDAEQIGINIVANASLDIAFYSMKRFEKVKQQLSGIRSANIEELRAVNSNAIKECEEMIEKFKKQLVLSNG